MRQQRTTDAYEEEVNRQQANDRIANRPKNRFHPVSVEQMAVRLRLEGVKPTEKDRTKAEPIKTGHQPDEGNGVNETVSLHEEQFNGR